MSLFIDVQFIQRVSFLLRNFRKKQDYVWNFSCPLCGDSEQKKSKARGYVFRDLKRPDTLAFKCHNCGRGLGFSEFVKHLDPQLHKEYVQESFLESDGHTVRKIEIHQQDKKKKAEEKRKKAELQKKLKIVRFQRPDALEKCIALAALPDGHPAKQYVLDRKIPALFLSQLFFTEDFAGIAKVVCPTLEQKLKPNEPRIIIPLLGQRNQLFGIQGRSLDKKCALRYITIKAFEDAPKIYGMHRLGDTIKRIYIFEGPFDSMFLPQALAMTGSDIPTAIPRERSIIVYDNEPRSSAICRKIEKAIDANYRVTIWPRAVDRVTFNHKDLNDMVLAGYTPAKLRQIIDTNSYVGAEAHLKLAAWRR